MNSKSKRRVVLTPASNVSGLHSDAALERVDTIVVLRLTDAAGHEQVYTVNAIRLLAALSNRGTEVLGSQDKPSAIGSTRPATTDI